ncbi:MAG: hypothetical protein J6U86_04225 [Clostridia bacterium]|nr:hypothetical protein [Clostridia bacterium]
MSNKLKYELLDIFARFCAVLPPLVATLYFFPEWIEKSPGATFSGTTLVIALICMIPFWKKLFDFAKNFTSTAMPVFWLVVFAVFMILKEIVDKFIYISLLGLLGSLISMGVCFWRNKYDTNKKMNNDDEDMIEENDNE